MSNLLRKISHHDVKRSTLKRSKTCDSGLFKLEKRLTVSI
jgi:hypothetical protein